MNKIEQLRQRRLAATARAEALLNAADAAGRVMTADEETAYAAATEEITGVDAQIQRHEEMLAFAANAPAVQTFSGDGTTVTTHGPGGVITSLKDLAAEKPWGVNTGAKFGEFLQAVYRAGTQQGTDPRLMAAALGLNETIGSDGGFLVGTDIANAIMLTMNTGAILSRVRHIPLSAGSNGVRVNVLDETSRATGSRFGGVQGYWLPEAGTKTASRPTFAQIELRLKKLACLGYATDELLEDAVALEAVMTEAFAEELRFLAEDAIIEGTGVGQPLGILNSPALITVAKETGQAAATILPENIAAMYSRLSPASRANAVWLVNSVAEGTFPLMTLAVGVGGVPVYMPPGGFAQAPYGTMLGLPVVATEYNSALGTVGDIILADLKKYGLIDRGGIQQNTSIHVAFTTDETAFRAVYRVDGQPLQRSPVTPFKGSVTTGPFVTLATRA